jgi:hypothetical protein
MRNLGDLRRIAETTISLSSECFYVHQGAAPLSIWPIGVTWETSIRLDDSRLVVMLPGQDTSLSSPTGITQEALEDLDCD